MSIVQQEHGIDHFVPTAPIGQHYSRIVTFADEVAEREPERPSTSVDIFKSDGKWYCQVRRGEEKTRPMGPYTELQAQRIQDARRRLLARKGTSGLTFR